MGLMPGGGGKVAECKEPAGVRVDSSVAAGTAAVTDYDPVIAKLIVKGGTYEETLAAAHAALEGYPVVWLCGHGMHLPFRIVFRWLK